MSWQSILADHLDRWEGLRLEAYQDSAGVWTIGWGHTGDDVHEGLTITRERAQELLAADVGWAARAFDQTVTVRTNAKMKAACVSLIFNIGSPAWRSSTCLKRLNARDYAGAAEALTWFNKRRNPATGQLVKSRGLTKRREAERRLFTEGYAELVGEDPYEAPMPRPKTGEAKGGEHKPLSQSKTFDTALLGTLLSGGSSIGASIAGMDWRVAIAFLVIGGGFAYLGFNRWLEWKRGEH